MSKGSIFLQYLCNLFYFYLLTLVIWKTFYKENKYPNFGKISKFVLPDALKILIHSLPLRKLLNFKLENTLF